MSDTSKTLAAPSWLGTPTVKMLLILGLVVLMEIPLYAVSGMVSERQSRQEEVLDNVRRSWGPAQAVTGPVLAVPFTWVEPATASTPAYARRSWFRVPARTLTVDAALSPETRVRGLFRATVYTAAVKLDAGITMPVLDLSPVANPTVLWNEAVIAVGATDLRAQPGEAELVLDGVKRALTVDEASGSCGGVATAPAGLTGPVAAGTVFGVQTGLRLRGTQSFAVNPVGRQVNLQVQAPWQTPSFGGAALPLSYEIDAAGFRAAWELGGQGARASSTGANIVPGCGSGTESQVGVDLLEAVPTYLMVTRAAKYGTLFLVLSFLTYFLIEQAARVRIHLAQYALLGLSESLFALIVMAVAEPTSFSVGYLVGTVAVMAQASLYTWSVTQRPRLAGMFAGILGLLFGLLYFILRLESFALLAGTVALFTILSVVMVATRRLDWSGRAPA